MELGRCVIRRARSNVLYSAFHDSHGLAWTDGRAIYLTEVNIVNGDIEKATPIKLGVFSEVESVHWSSNVEVSAENDIKYCYLCVVHKETVTIWKVDGFVPNLSFKQVRKINSQPIPSGCLWNTKRDMLCLLTKKRSSFYFNHSQNKGSYSLPTIESGSISCGCWSDDGKKLIVGIGAVVIIYQWQDIDKSISEYTIIAWKIPGISGNLCAFMPYTEDKILCTVELPLDQLCSTHDQYFDIPDISLFDGSKGGAKPYDDDSERNALSKVSLTTENSVDVKRNNVSPAENLFNLQRSVQTPKQECSQLILFDLQGKSIEPHRLAAQNIQGVLSPDLLYCQNCTDTVIVGSHTQNALHLYCIKDDSFMTAQLLHLEEEERPKGICEALVGRNGHKYPDGILTMIAKKQNTDNTFLPISSYAEYDVALKYLALPGQSQRTYVQNPKELPNIKMFREIQLPNGSSKVHLLRISPLRNQCSSIEQDEANQPKIFPDKLEGVLRSDSPESSSQNSSKFSHHGSRAESPEFNLVLPNTNEITLHNDEIKSPKIVVLNNSNGFNHYKLDKEICVQNEDKTHFDQKPAKFKNKVKRFFEGNGIKPTPLLQTISGAVEGDVVFGKTVLEDDKAMCITRIPSNSSSEHFVQSDHVGLGQQVTTMEAQINSQKQHISELQSRVSEITKHLEDIIASKDLHHNYNTLSNCDVVHLLLKNSTNNKHDTNIKKCFLLDNKRLKLDAVKEAFQLNTVEFLIDGVLCVVGSNTNGYIPLLLQPNTTIEISGNKAI